MPDLTKPINRDNLEAVYDEAAGSARRFYVKVTDWLNKAPAKAKAAPVEKKAVKKPQFEGSKPAKS